MGRPTIIDVVAEGQRVSALLDTGATVSTIKESVAGRLGLQVNPTNEISKVECANGQSLPFIGCTVADISIPNSFPTHVSLKRTPQFCPPVPCLLLVVADNCHTQSVPLLLGTNNLEKLIPGNCELPGPLNIVVSCLRQRRQYLQANDGSIAALEYDGPNAALLPIAAMVEIQTC